MPESEQDDPRSHTEQLQKYSSRQWKSELARNGQITVRANSHLLHSRFNPEEEARRTAQTIPPQTAVLVLGGLGLGYIAEAILQNQHTEFRLIIAEADPSAPNTAAKIRNNQSLLSDPRITLLTDKNPETIQNLLRKGPAGQKIHYLEWQPSTRLYPEWYDRLSQIVRQTIHRRSVNAHTLDKFGPLWVRNLAANSRILGNALSLAQWENSLKHIPALILAGGPSLENTLPYLQTLRQSHLIIAVDTALRALQQVKIEPDIIVAVDPQYWNTRHLDRSEYPNSLILAETATHPSVFRTLKGRPLLMRTRYPLGTLLENAAGLEGELRAGGSVATVAWDLARHLGCSPLTIAGLDLGFPGKRTHYKGSLSQILPHYQATRLVPAETPSKIALLGTHLVPSITDQSIPTNPSMDLYAAWFEEHSGEINGQAALLLGKTGRKIRGLKPINPEKLLHHPNNRPSINTLIKTMQYHPANPEVPIQVKTAIHQAFLAMQKLKEQAEKGIQTAKKAQLAQTKKTPLTPLLAKMEHIDKNLLQTQSRDIISFLIQPIILRMSTTTSENTDPIEDSLILYREISRSAAYHIKYLNKYY